MPAKVLLLSASSGAGHVRAADALHRAAADFPGVEAEHVDALKYTSRLFRELYSRAYLELVDHAPEVLGWLYDHTDHPWRNMRRRLAIDRLNAGRFIRLIEHHQPDICISTHFLPAEIVSWLCLKKKLCARHAVVVTDVDVHAMWLCRSYDYYFVAREETRQHLMALGFPAEKVVPSGIPIDPRFAEPLDRATARRKHGLDPDRPVLLVSAGGFGMAAAERIVDRLLALAIPAQVVAISGKNEKLKHALEARGARNRVGAVRLHVVGYTTEMDEWMAAADLLVGKAGGLTTSEALARELPMVIINPIPGQEQRNSDHLLEAGAAIKGNNLPALPYKIGALLGDTRRLESMRSAARRLARPHAAHDILSRVLAQTPPQGAGR